jgi:hypothetical protein
MSFWISLSLRKICTIGACDIFHTKHRTKYLLKYAPNTARNTWIGHIMLPVPELILCPLKASKTSKIHCFFPKNWASLFIPNLFFSPLYNPKKTSYANVPEIIKFNPKPSIQKYPIFCSWYNYFNANVSEFYTYLPTKNQKSLVGH